MTEELTQVASTDDEPSAEALAGLLRTEGVPTIVQVISPVPGIVEEVQIRVPASLAHRARWIINSLKVCDEELRFTATGELGRGDSDQ